MNDSNAGSDPNRIVRSIFDLTFSNATAFSITDIALSLTGDESTVSASLRQLTGTPSNLFLLSTGVADFDFTTALDPMQQYQLAIRSDFVRFGGNGNAGLDDTGNWSFGSLDITGVSSPPTTVPEPTSLALLGLGGILLRIAGRRRTA